MYSLMGEVGILANICNRVNRWPARKNNSVFSRKTKRKERLIRDEKESSKDFIEEVNFGLSLKRSRYSSKLKKKGRESVTGKGRCKTVLCIQGTASS